MSEYYVEAISVKNLWGSRDISLQFRQDTNLIIGPNASGKTTILNILRFVLTVDVMNLVAIVFDEARITLKSFDGQSRKTIVVSPADNGLNFQVSQRTFHVTLSGIPSNYLYSARGRMFVRERTHELADLLSGLVPAVWLPVSRRLPISEEDEQLLPQRQSSGRRELESVDERLESLIEELAKYRSKLQTQLAERYKDFERRVLELILYDKLEDQFTTIVFPEDDEKDQLLGAFTAAGLLDATMKRRIDEHFASAKDLERKFKDATPGSPKISAEDIFIIPLLRRTKSVIKYARELEEYRTILFQSLRRYEEIVTSFLAGKHAAVDEQGKLSIISMEGNKKSIGIPQLSSGEKQILIFLTQALVGGDRPLVFIADEPELSLHVTWQAKLIPCIRSLAPTVQIIVATHSPDIVGQDVDKIIDLGKGSK